MIYFTKNLGLISVFALLLFATSCAHDHAHDSSGGHSHGDDGHALVHSGGVKDGMVHLTSKQMKTINVQYGTFSKIKINDYVSATGTLDLPPNAYASVSAKAAGFIRGSQKYVEGSYIKKGVLMGYIENPQFIERQQEYLEIKTELSYLNLELSRQKALVDANAGIEKHVQKLESEVAIKEVKMKGIAKYLSYLGITTQNLTIDNIRQRITIVAPMSGYLTSIQMHNGLYVEPKMELMEIVDEGHLHLELDVFEKDIAFIKEEQKITYTVPALGNAQFEGEVHVIGKEFNKDNKTLRIHGHLGKERPTFIKDLFISAKIWLNDQIVDALPEASVIRDGAASYIYVGENNPDAEESQFKKIMVIPGIADEGFVAVEILDEIPDGMEIVTNGTYYIYAQSMAAELTHEH